MRKNKQNVPAIAVCLRRFSPCCYLLFRPLRINRVTRILPLSYFVLSLAPVEVVAIVYGISVCIDCWSSDSVLFWRNTRTCGLSQSQGHFAIKSQRHRRRSCWWLWRSNINIARRFHPERQWRPEILEGSTNERTNERAPPPASQAEALIDKQATNVLYYNTPICGSISNSLRRARAPKSVFSC